ncbi:hypothetical protein [Archangium sp.]|uniref:hypothetical protein n=1 Tax=Archangium sp. TaxID=1872627 RepID=UPI00389992FA
MHEHTPSEEAPEPTEDSEAADPTGAILLHVFLVGLVLVPTGMYAHTVSQPSYGAGSMIPMGPLMFVLAWLSFAVYVVISTVGAVQNWREVGVMLAYHLGALVLAVPGAIALLVLWNWLQGLFHG